MTSKINDILFELESKIQILELENETLSEKAEENLLLNKAFEEINIIENIDKLILNTLESISVLLNIQFSGLFELIGSKLICKNSYALFSTTETTDVVFYVPDSAINVLIQNTTCFLDRSYDEFIFNYSNSDFRAEQAILIPIISEINKNQYFVFINENDGLSLQERIPLFEKVVKIISTKLDRIYFQNELQILNEELEKKIELRTKELKLRNDELIAERLRAERSERQAKNILQTAMDGFWIVDLEGCFVEVNEVACKMLGYTKEEFLKLRISDVEANESKEQIQSHIKEVMISEEDRFESQHRAKNGQIIDVEVSAKFQEDLSLLVIFSKDISQRKKSELALKASEERFELAMKASSDGLFDWNLETNEVYFSPGWKKIIGYKDNELPNELSIIKTLAKVDDLENIKHLKEKLLSNRESDRLMFDYELKHKDGHWVNVLLKAEAIFDSNSKPIRIIGTHSDITEQKLTEKSLLESETRFKALHNASFGGIAIHDKGLILDCNKGLSELTGYSNNELIGMDGLLLIAEKSREIVRENIRSAYEKPYEVFGLKKNGEEYPARLEGRVIPYKGSNVRVVEFRDITESKNVENKLKEALVKATESDRLKSAFLANMSHEIRTPMNGILGFAEVLKDTELSGEKQHEYLEIIEKSGIRMLNIINDIIDISKIESGQMKVIHEPTNVRDQLNFLYAFFKPEVELKGIKLKLTNLPQLSEAVIQTDREKLYSILTNLIKNAIKYTKAGSIEFGCSPTIPSNSWLNETELQFYVRDTGIGIPAQRQDAVFERFIQADIADKMARQGAGLGLAISKGYIEMLGGKIWLESEVGKGSTFYFTIPYAFKPNKQLTSNEVVPDHIDETPATELKILIAEDDNASSKFISILVEKYSSEILTVQTGIDALETCRRRSDLDLIFMDIQLPEMDGYEATRQIRKFNSKIVIIAQTAYALSGDNEKALDAGCNDYIAKPIRKDELLLLMNKYFRNK